MSESLPTSEDAPVDSAVPVKKRSPVERALVWSLIAGGLVVAGVEGAAKYGYDTTRVSVQELIARDPEGVVKLSEVQKLVSGVSSRTESDGTLVGGIAARRTLKYRWFSIFKPEEYQITLSVEAGEEDPLVLNFETSKAPVPQPILMAGGEGELEGEDGSTGFGGGGGGGGGFGGGGGMQHDAEEPGGTGSGGGGGRRQRGPRRSAGMLGDLQQEWVQTELGLTAEQIDQIGEIASGARPDYSSFREMSPEERTAALRAIEQQGETGAQQVLDEEQFARARELMLQRVGVAALLRDDVQVELALTDAQKTQVGELSSELRAALREAGFRASQEERDHAAAPWKALLLEVLTEEQSGRWEAMLGEPPEHRPDAQARPQRPPADNASE